MACAEADSAVDLTHPTDTGTPADYFALMGLPRRQALDLALLEARYQALQARVHPDKHTQDTAPQRRLAMQMATEANAAWQTLRDPARRAAYLLNLSGHALDMEVNTAMPPEFLLQQMELREAVADAAAAQDAEGLHTLHRAAQAHLRQLHDEIEAAIDTAHNPARASDLVRQTLFQKKLVTEIETALDDVDA